MLRPPPTSTLFPYTTLFRSWQQAELSGEVTGQGVLRVLEAIRVCSGISGSRTPGRGQIRFYQASSSEIDRKSTRLNSSHLGISYAVFCLKKKKKNNKDRTDT